MNIKNITATILAVLATVGVLIIMGYIPYKFVGYLLLSMIMYLYVSLSEIEDVLVRSLGLLAIVGVIVGWWTGLFNVIGELFNRILGQEGMQEGMFVSPVTKISDALTAKQCQDTCEQSKTCKFSQVPLDTTKTGGKYPCWNSYGVYQRAWGSRRQGGDTWQNKLYREPITVGETRGYNRWTPNVAYKTTSGRPHTLWISDVRTNMIPNQVCLTVSLRDQGWGNPTWGIYVVGYDPWGREKFREVMQAPRTARQVRYPIYTSYTYTVRQPYRSCSWQHYHCWRGSWWRRKCHSHYHCSTRYRNVKKTGKRVARYGSRNVQGGLSTRSLCWYLNQPGRKSTNGPITRIKVFAQTRGQGHNLEAGRVVWSVRGWPQSGARSSYGNYGKSFSPPPPPKPPYIQIIGGSWYRCKKNNLVKTFVIRPNYQLSFDIHPEGTRGGWTNILHSTLSRSNCCGSRDRCPAVWFHSNTFRLHIRTSTNSVGNFGHDPGTQINRHGSTNVIIRVQGSRLTITYRGSTNYTWSGYINPSRQSGTTYFYVSDPWYTASYCYVRNVRWLNL